MFLLSNIEQKLFIYMYIAFALSKSFAVKMSSAVLTEKFGKSYILKQKLQNHVILFKTSRVLELLYTISIGNHAMASTIRD